MDVEIDYGPDSADDPVANALGQLAAIDADFNFASLQRQWCRYGYVTPRQMVLLAWRLQIHGIDHEPSQFKVRTNTAKDRQAVEAMEHWRREQLREYLTEEQRIEFGL